MVLSRSSSGFCAQKYAKNFLLIIVALGRPTLELTKPFSAGESLRLWLYRNLLMVIYNGKWIFDRFHFTLSLRRVGAEYYYFSTIRYSFSVFYAVTIRFYGNFSLFSACDFSFNILFYFYFFRLFFGFAVKRKCNWNRSNLCHIISVKLWHMQCLNIIRY